MQQNNAYLITAVLLSNTCPKLQQDKKISRDFLFRIENLLYKYKSLHYNMKVYFRIRKFTLE